MKPNVNKLVKDITRFITILSVEQLEQLQKIICVDVNGSPCGMDCNSIDPDCSYCNGTGFCIDIKGQ